MENENLDGQETEVEVKGTFDEPTETEALDAESTEAGEQEKTDDEPVEPVENEQPEEKEDGVQKRINKAVRRQREAEEAAEKERQKREEIEKKLQEMSKEEIPDIPEVPDYLDPDYEQKIKERDEIIAKHAQENSRKAQLAQIEADKATEELVKRNTEIKKQEDAFNVRIDELKIDHKSFNDSANVVVKKVPELATFFLEDTENGPLNVMYLSQNVEELEKVSKMSPTSAAAYIATTIAPEAQKLKPKQTKAPDVPYDPQGNRKMVDDDPLIAGATFE